MKRTVKIEDRYKLGLCSKGSQFRFSVVKKREDGMEWSVGTAPTMSKAKALKKKNLWSKKRRR